MVKDRYDIETNVLFLPQSDALCVISFFHSGAKSKLTTTDLPVVECVTDKIKNTNENISNVALILCSSSMFARDVCHSNECNLHLKITSFFRPFARRLFDLKGSSKMHFINIFVEQTWLQVTGDRKRKFPAILLFTTARDWYSGTKTNRASPPWARAHESLTN